MNTEMNTMCIQNLETTENKKEQKPHKIKVSTLSKMYWKVLMETAGVEPASKHIATQKTTLIVRSFEIRAVKRRGTGFLLC